jgi:hypothetical protein
MSTDPSWRQLSQPFHFQWITQESFVLAGRVSLSTRSYLDDPAQMSDAAPRRDETFNNHDCALCRVRSYVV